MSGKGKKRRPSSETTKKTEKKEKESSRKKSKSTRAAAAAAATAAGPSSTGAGPSSSQQPRSTAAAPAERAAPPPRPRQRTMDEDEGNDPRRSSALQGLLRKLGGFADAYGAGGGGGGGSSAASRARALLPALLRGLSAEALAAIQETAGGSYISSSSLASAAAAAAAAAAGTEDDDGGSSRAAALGELCELLSVSSEDALATFPVAALVPALVATLREGCNATPLGAELPLLAARALTYLADALPQATGALLSDPRGGAGCLEPVTATLQAPECIDLAEQCVALLDRVSSSHPRAVLRAGGIPAALACIDFYATGVARTAARAAANAARALGNGERSSVASAALAAARGGASQASASDTEPLKSDAALAAEAVPPLAGLLHSQDPRVVEAGCSALCAAAAALGDGKPGADDDPTNADANKQTDHARALSQAGLVQACVALLRVRDEDGGAAAPGMGSPGTYLAVLRLLAALCAARADAAAAALGAGAAGVLKALLATSPLLSTAVVENSDSSSSSSSSKPAALLRSGDQLAVALSAVASLLPPLADAAAVVATGLPANSLARDANDGNDGKTVSAAALSRSAWLAAHPTVAAQATAGLLGLLVAAYDGGGAASSPAARALCVDVVSRAVAASPSQALREAIDDVPASSFVAAMLRARDAGAVASGVRLAELLQDKLPDVAAVFFPKEGVLAGLRKLAVGEGLLMPPPPPTTNEAAAGSAPTRLSRASARLRERQRTGSDSEQPSAAAAAGAPVASSPPSSSLRSAAAARAALFLASRFPAAAASGDADTDAARALRAAAEALPTDGPAKLFELVGGGASVPGGRVSAHELLAARVPAALRAYLAGEDLLLKEEKDGDEDGGEGGSAAAAAAAPPSKAAAEALLSRALGFLDAGEVETANASASGGGSTSSSSRLRSLVRVLHEALNASDRFALAASSPSSSAAGESASGTGVASGGSAAARAAAAQRYGGGGSTSASMPFGSSAPQGAAGSLGAGLAQLSQPLRLRLTVAPTTTISAAAGGEATSRRRLRDAGAAIVLVEPLATLSAVEDFLWPRVAPPPLPTEQQQPPSGAAAAAAAAARAAAGEETGGGAGAATAAARRGSGRPGSGGGGGSAAAAAAIPGRGGRSGAAAAGGGGSGGGGATTRAAATTTTGARRRRGGGAAAAADDDDDEEMADAPWTEEDEAGGEASDDDDGGEGDSEDSEEDDDEEGAPRRRGGRGDEADFAFDAEDDLNHAAALFDDEDDDEDDYDDFDDEEGMMDEEGGLAGYRAAAGGGGGGGGGPSSATASRSYAAAASAARPRLRFRVDGVVVPSDATVFQALNAAAAAREDAEAAAGTGAGGGGEGGTSGSFSDSASGVSARRRLWHDIHTITYELFEDDGGEVAAAGAGEGTAMAVDNNDANAPAAATTNAAAISSSANPTAVAAAASRWARADPPLPPELVFAAAAAKNGLVVASASSSASALSSSSPDLTTAPPASRAAAFFRLSGDGADVLAVLKALHALNAARPRLAAAAALRKGEAPPAELPRPPLRSADFVNPRLAPRLALQLKDVLAVAGGCLPPWVPALASGARFVFPGPLRARFVRLTCFGLPRALMHMAGVNAAEAAAASNGSGNGSSSGGGGNNGGGTGGPDSSSAADDARVARVARQRVRVDRAHVLDAAGRVLAAHAAGRPLLEFEFAGEPGVGLGPTLEFYTLVASEMQRPGLGMWRGDAAAPSAGGRPSSKGLESGGGGGGGGGSGGAAAARPRSASASASEPAPPASSAPTPSSPSIDAPLGLFPAPLPLKGGGPGADRALSRFRTLGRLAGRALRDGRLLDLRVARPFWAAVTGASLTLADLRGVDEQLARSLEALEAAAVAAERREEEAEKEEGGDDGEMNVEGSDDGDKKKKKKKDKKKKVAVFVGGCPLEDLGLTWELPGFPSFKLKSVGGEGRRSSSGSGGGEGGSGSSRRRSSSSSAGGKSSHHSPRHGSAVTDAATLRRYVAACVDATVGSGVSRAVEAFRTGFADAAGGSLRCLGPFGAAEVDELICGEGVGGSEESWSRAALTAAVRFDHGYTAASPSAAAFLDALASLEPADRRAFVAWATGCPRLPPGGLAALTPRLTVVRKAPSAPSSSAVIALSPGGEEGAGAGGGVASSLMTTTGGGVGGGLNISSSSAPAFPGAFATAADADLPSVMTCANYVKLPPYSSAAAAKARLLVAIREGAGSFDLS